MKNQWLYKISSALLVVMLAVAALPVTSAYAAPVTYNFQISNAAAVATGITTNDAFCGSNPTAATRTLMTTAAHTCGSERISLAATGTLLDVWYNTAYASGTTVSGTSLKVHLREAQIGGGTQTWTAGVMLMYVNAAGVITNFTGPEVTQVVANNVDSDFTLDLSGQSATIPAGSKLGIRIRVISTTSNAARVYFGSTANAAGTGTSGVLIVDEAPALTSQTINFTSTAPVAAVYAGATYTPTATATSGLPVTITVDPTASSVCSITAGVVSFIGVGTCVLDANQAGNGTYSAAPQVQQSFAVGKATPTATVTNTPQNYTGAAQSATVTCSGGGVVSNILTGGAASQTNAGTYAVTVNCAASANYNAATNLAAGNFVINRINPTASITNSPVNYNGALQTATVACLGGGTATIATGGTGTNAGSYATTVNCAISTNYNAANGLAAGNFVINRINPTASITNSPANYNGALQTATVTCLGGGTATIATGGTGTNAGSYATTVNCAISTNYNAVNGLAAGNFVINRINPTATVTNTPQNYTGAAQSAAVSCIGGGATSNILTGGAASQTNAGTYAVTADCAASTNYNAAAGVAAGNFVINRINPTASITNSPVNYNGALQTATVACLGGGTATIATGGTGTNAGSYATTVNCAISTNYNAVNGLAAGNFVINRINPTASITNSPVNYNGALQTAAVACLGGGTATIATGGTGTNAGSYATTVNCAISTNYNAANGLASGNFVINPAIPTVTVTNGPVSYDGLTHAATVSCLGGGAASNILTGGAANQTNAGTYTVTADCAATTNYAAATGATAGNNFVINRINPTASVTNTPQDYTGAAQSAAVSCIGGGAASNILTGGAASQTNAGTYAVIADCAVSTNYNAATGVAAGNFVINQIAPTATVTNTPQNYTGLAQSAVVACSGGGIASNILTGGAASQIDAGSYAVTADCAASTNYITATGVTAGNFVINNIGQTITVTTSAPATASNGSSFNVAATADSGLIVSISASGVCSFVDNGDGTASITMTSGTGTCTVSYNQAGDINYSAATQVQENTNATQGPSFTSANSTSFDMGFPGTFTVTATGNPTTMTIVSAGVLPSGVTLTDNGDGTALLAGTPAAGTNGTYPLTFTANNGVTPNGTQNFTLIVRNGPTVSANGINSTPDTGDASVSENELILDTLGITSLTVQFNQDVYDDPTDALDYGHDVTNPANYILVRSTNGVYATVDCKGGVLPPDVAISVDFVTYSNGGGSGPYIATLSINGGLPLNVVGFYRLYVCGTTSIVDANNRGLELAGNGTTPGTDFQRNFRVATVVAGGGGGGGGSASSSKTTVTSSFLIPVTGFAPNQITTLPAQPADINYASMGQMTIEIPALGVKYPIVGASITNRTWDLTWLKDSVAYLEGSAYPTTAGNTVLTAHVQDANKNLGPFSDIKGMELGQKVYIHVNGQIYVYQVQENRKISANNITEMFKHEEDSWLTLVTCEDFNAKTGLYTSRRMVRAVLISVIFEK